MPLRKIFPPVIFLLFSLACSRTSFISGPTVEPTMPASGTVLFKDEFENPLSGWDKASTPLGLMDYDGGVYRILVDEPNFNFWSTPGKVYTDVRIEVDTVKVGGPDSNRAGLICRWAGNQFYFFVISSDGYFAVGRMLIREDQTTQVTLLGQDQMSLSTNIRAGLAINHLRADCAGNTLSFYINGFPVAQVNDSALASGEVGLIAGAFEQGGADIIFDKFVILQP